VGHRERGHRALHPRAVRARGRRILFTELRRPSGKPARVRAVRPREGIVHGGGPGQTRSVRRGARRYVLPGRNRRDVPRDPGETAARAAGAGGGPRGRDRGPAGRGTGQRPAAAAEALPLDVRGVAPTNRDLEDDIKRGRFRTDLYYRLNVIAIHLPPLRDRRDDIQILCDEFLGRIAQERSEKPKPLSQEAQGVLLAYDWPGNV